MSFVFVLDRHLILSCKPKLPRKCLLTVINSECVPTKTKLRWFNDLVLPLLPTNYVCPFATAQRKWNLPRRTMACLFTSPRSAQPDPCLFGQLLSHLLPRIRGHLQETNWMFLWMSLPLNEFNFIIHVQHPRLASSPSSGIYKSTSSHIVVHLTVWIIPLDIYLPHNNNNIASLHLENYEKCPL